jgi:hypothetical protein
VGTIDHVNLTGWYRTMTRIYPEGVDISVQILGHTDPAADYNVAILCYARILLRSIIDFMKWKLTT